MLRHLKQWVDYSFPYTLFWLLLFLLVSSPVYADTEPIPVQLLGIKWGYFDNTDPRIEDFYGHSYLYAVEYEHRLGRSLSLNTDFGIAYSQKFYHQELQSLTRIMVDFSFRHYFRPVQGRLYPFIDFGYFFLYSKENSGEGFDEFTEGGFPSESIGYSMAFGVRWRLTKHSLLSWQTRLRAAKVYSSYTLGDLDYGGYASTIGLSFTF